MDVIKFLRKQEVYKVYLYKLLSISEYMRKEFGSGLRKETEEIDLSEFSKSTINILMNYIEYGKLAYTTKMNEQNAKELLQIAEFLLINDLIDILDWKPDSWKFAKNFYVTEDDRDKLNEMNTEQEITYVTENFLHLNFKRGDILHLEESEDMIDMGNRKFIFDGQKLIITDPFGSIPSNFYDMVFYRVPLNYWPDFSLPFYLKPFTLEILKNLEKVDSKYYKRLFRSFIKILHRRLDLYFTFKHTNDPKDVITKYLNDNSVVYNVISYDDFPREEFYVSLTREIFEEDSRGLIPYKPSETVIFDINM